MSVRSEIDVQDLGQRRRAVLKELSWLEEELNKRRAQDRHVMRAEDVEWSEEGFGIRLRGRQGRGATLIAPELGFNCRNFGAVFLEVPPGSQEGSYHIHGEAVKHYLQGEGLEIIGGKEYHVKAGDTVFVPANVWHGTQNTGEIPLRFFAAVHSGLGVPVVHQVITSTRDDEGQGGDDFEPERADYGTLGHLAISRKRKELVREASKIEQERNKLRDQDRHIMRAEDVVWSDGGFGISLKGSSGRGASLVAPDLGFNVHNLAATFLEVPPGSEEGLYHVHGEAIKFYLEGEGVECIGDKQYPVKAGDVAFIPANVWHGTNNPGSIPFRFLAIDPSHTNPYQLHRIFTFDYRDRDPLAPLIGRGS